MLNKKRGRPAVHETQQQRYAVASKKRTAAAQTMRVVSELTKRGAVVLFSKNIATIRRHDKEAECDVDALHAFDVSEF